VWPRYWLEAVVALSLARWRLARSACERGLGEGGRPRGRVEFVVTEKGVFCVTGVTGNRFFVTVTGVFIVTAGLLSVTVSEVFVVTLDRFFVTLLRARRACCFRSSAMTSAIAGQGWVDQWRVLQTMQRGASIIYLGARVMPARLVLAPL